MRATIKQTFLLAGILACCIVVAWPFILIAGLWAADYADYIHRALRLLAWSAIAGPIAMVIGWPT